MSDGPDSPWPDDPSPALLQQRRELLDAILRKGALPAEAEALVAKVASYARPTLPKRYHTGRIVGAAARLRAGLTAEMTARGDAHRSEVRKLIARGMGLDDARELVALGFGV